MNIKKFHGYECGGCGHITITDKYYKIKLTHCAVCGDKKTVFYLSEFKVQPVHKFIFKKGEM